ncbi:hypothetical protein IWQ60_003590 [Tieghemiomyces parasiticus]|uniref:RRM domain-containing protein n=1 Tax=Tieghemiomyces parasiticus TaxID=78921 RepID=A0A9W8E033_9FUNG|nr:hypothetical protein IWQ60_003590 [Tieghemiomyces parasiticus]
MLAKGKPTNRKVSGQPGGRKTDEVLANDIGSLGLQPRGESPDALARGLPLTVPRLFFAGLPASVTLQEVQQVFKEHRATGIQISLDSSANLSRGQVDFATVDEAELVFASLHGTPVRALADSLLYLSPTEEVDPYGKGCELRQPKLMVRSLPETTTDAELFRVFRPIGPLFTCKVGLTDQGACRGFAVVQFVDPRDGDRAIAELNCTELLNQTISVGPFLPKDRKLTPQANPRVPSRGRLSLGDELNLNRATGSISPAVKSPRSPATPSLGISPLPALTPTPGDKRKPQSRVPTPIGTPAAAANRQPDTCKLFVKGLHYHVSHQDLFQTFKPYGYIYSAKVTIDETTKTSKGSGVVIFANPEDVTKAIAGLQGQELMGRKLALLPYDSSLAPAATSIPTTPKAATPTSKAAAGPDPSAFSPPSPSHGQSPISALGDVTTNMTASTPTRAGPRKTSNPPLPPANLPRDPQIDRAHLDSLTPTARRQLLETKLTTAMSINPAISLHDAPAVVEHLAGAEMDDVLRMLEEKKHLEFKIKEARARIAMNNRKSGNKPRRKSTSKPEGKAADEMGRGTSVAPVTATSPPKTPLDKTVEMTKETATLDVQEVVKSSQPSTPAKPAAPEPTANSTATASVGTETQDLEIEALITQLFEKSGNERKQKLGSKLFPLVKGLGVKEATKVTVWLLDNKTDVRFLAYALKDPIRLQQCVTEAHAALGIQ